MGSREDRLDALLAAMGPTPPAAPPGAAGRGGSADVLDQPPSAVDSQLAPLLVAAGDLAKIGSARPDPAFAARLGQRVLARADLLRHEAIDTVPMSVVVARGKGARWPTALRLTFLLPWRAAGPHVAVRKARKALLAAVALVGLGIGVWAVASVTSAMPGSPFFGLHQLGQNLGMNLMDADGRAKAHIQAARDWLAQLRADAIGQGDANAYGATLNVMLAEDSAAALAIQQAPPSTDRDSLIAQLAALRGSERTTLRAVLPRIGWPDRIATTQALGHLGIAVPHVTTATVTQGHGLWQVTLAGDGFAPGAVLLIDGHALGSVTQESATTLIAQAPSGAFKNGQVTVGVGNPDDTAATTSNLILIVVPTATPGGNGGNGGKGPHGSPTHTPDPKDSGQSGSGGGSGH